MKQAKQTKAQLEKRRDEIKAQLNRVNADERIELERDMEDQAQQVEQQDVSTMMEANLQKELAEVEDKLLDFDEK